MVRLWPSGRIGMSREHRISSLDDGTDPGENQDTGGCWAARSWTDRPAALQCAVRTSSPALCCQPPPSVRFAPMASTHSDTAHHPDRPANRLAGETSPYLLQHAHNPVDWYPWGPEALERARSENRPIFLSIGYSACHWCHVMERESFENPDIAARDERALRQHQGRPRGAARPRPDLHERRPGDDRPRRLADVGLPHARARALLRRHLFPAHRLAGHAGLSPASCSACTGPGKSGGTRSSGRPPR